jgi:hypothetical protein
MPSLQRLQYRRLFVEMVVLPPRRLAASTTTSDAGSVCSLY